MCGIVGVAGNLFGEDLKIFKDLLFIDTLRGQDSTGILAACPKQWAYHKAAIPGPDFLTMRKAEKLITTQKQVLIGHNRAATVGKVNSHNAHPFASENEAIVGVHNGTLIGYETRKFITDYDEYGTDSEALINSISTAGVEKTLGNVVGAFALAFLDTKQHKLYLTRNKERPLHFAVPEGRKQLYWASELGMLRWAIERHKPAAKMKYYYIKENDILSWDLPENATQALPDYEMSKFIPTERPSYANSSPYGGHGGSVLPFRDKTSQSQKKTSSSAIVDPLRLSRLDAFKAKLQIDAPFVHRTSTNQPLDSKAAREHFVGRNASCCCCGADISPESRWRVFPEKNFLCEDCAEDDNLIQDLVNQGVG